MGGGSMVGGDHRHWQARRLESARRETVRRLWSRWRWFVAGVVFVAATMIGVTIEARIILRPASSQAPPGLESNPTTIGACRAQDVKVAVTTDAHHYRAGHPVNITLVVTDRAKFDCLLSGGCFPRITVREVAGPVVWDWGVPASGGASCASGGGVVARRPSRLTASWDQADCVPSRALGACDTVNRNTHRAPVGLYEVTAQVPPGHDQNAFFTLT